MAPGNQIIAFEPQRMVYYQLCGNLILNSLDSVVALNLALGSEAAELDLPMPVYGLDSNVGAFSLDPQVRHEIKDHITQGNTETVELVTIDSLELDDVRLIKLDVEGLEQQVLQGGVQTLERNHYPPILFESWTQYSWWAERQQALWSYLASMGYKIREVCYNNYIAEQ
jgi:FkbM family methyltransferase